MNSVAKEMLLGREEHELAHCTTSSRLRGARIIPLTLALSILMVAYGLVVATILSA